MVLDTRNVVETAIGVSIKTIKKIANEQYQEYLTNRVVNRPVPANDPIKMNKLPMFSCPSRASSHKGKQLIKTLKSDCALFFRLYIPGIFFGYFSPIHQSTPKTCFKS